MTPVTCDDAHELVSADLDGELEPADRAGLDAHLQTCESCRDYQEDAHALRRALRVRVVDDDPEDATTIDVVGSLQGVSVLRWALFVIGGTLVILNVPAIVSADGSAAAHLHRHDGVFGTALGIAMIAVAVRPHRAIGLIPLTSAITVLMAIAAAADLVSGNAQPLGEAIHVVEFGGLVCLWVISGGPSRMAPRLRRLAAMLPSRRSGPDHGRDTKGAVVRQMPNLHRLEASGMPRR